MRVLLLITDLQLGGTPTVVRELAVRLHKAGTEIEVACLSQWGPVADQLKAAGVTVTALGAHGSGDLRIIRRLVHLIRERRVTTVFSFLIHANTIGAIASLIAGEVRWIQSIQTTQPFPRWHWFLQRLVHHAAEQVVVPSASVAKASSDWAGIDSEKIIVIPNAIDPLDWIEAQSHVPAHDPRPYPVAFLGRLDPIKDIPTLIAAAAILSPLVYLHLYGEGADRKRIEAEIARTHAPVTLHGAVASPQEALSRSGLLVLPSLAEGFGLVLIEAMAAGVPVVASDVPGIRDVIRNEVTGLLVPPRDPAALASAIGRVVHDASLRERLIARAREDVRDRFSWTAVLKLYQQLLGSQATSTRRAEEKASMARGAT